jgi:hypothetical protein
VGDIDDSGPLVGLHEVLVLADQAEGVGRVGRDGEVVHLIVEDDARGAADDARAEPEVHGGAEGDGVPLPRR